MKGILYKPVHKIFFAYFILFWWFLFETKAKQIFPMLSF